MKADRPRRRALLVVACLLGAPAIASCSDPPPVASSKEGVATTVKPVRSVIGRVTDTEGNPVADAGIMSASVDDPPVPVPEIVMTTDDDGRYVVALPPGRFELKVWAEGYASTSREVQVEASKTVTLDFTLTSE